MKKEFFVIVMLLFLLAGCVEPPVPDNQDIQDCGKDLDCFKQAAANGEKAVFLIEEEGAAFSQTIKECDNQECTVFMKLTKVPDSVPEELRALVLLSGEMTCQVSLGKLGGIPEEIDKCSGPLVEAAKAFAEQQQGTG